MGQMALTQFPEPGYAPLFQVCFAVAVGIIPIAVTRRIHPKPLKPLQFGLLSYSKLIPQSLVAIFCTGMINGSFYGLAPTFARQAGFDAQDIATFMSVTVLAGLLAQWPMGLLSDRVPRSVLLRFNAVVLVVIASVLFIVPLSHFAILCLTAMFGVMAFTLYPLCSALANSRVSDEERVGVSSALLMAFGTGAGLGSATLAQAMNYFGHTALYGAIATLAAIMFVLLTLINLRQKAEQPTHSDFVVSVSDMTNSPLAATMDPRIEEAIAQDQLLVVDGKDREADMPRG